MRNQILKLQRSKSTKSERIFMEILKSLRIPFRTKVMLSGKEIDFLVGKYAIEINGHDQSTIKNSQLLESGYIPIHYNNSDIKNHREEVKQEIKLKWHEYETQN